MELNFKGNAEEIQRNAYYILMRHLKVDDVDCILVQGAEAEPWFRLAEDSLTQSQCTASSMEENRDDIL